MDYDLDSETRLMLADLRMQRAAGCRATRATVLMLGTLVTLATLATMILLRS